MKTNGKRVAGLLLAAVSACVISGCACSAPTAAQTAATPATQPSVRYPIPYQTPSRQSIVDVMERVRARLEANVPMRIIEHPTASEMIPPDPTATTQPAGPVPPMLDRGPEWKFSPNQYPLGVIYAAMIEASEVTGDPQFNDFVAKRFRFFADNLAKAPTPPLTDAEARMQPLRPLLAPRALDDCGAMGASFIKARRANVGPDLQPVIDRFAVYIMTGQSRLADGTLDRDRPYKDSIWGDDMYMSVPFLAQMGALSGDKKFFDEACKQVLQIGGHLWVPQTELFTHAWHASAGEDHPHYFWGRANGWCMMAMVELLSVLPEDHPSRPAIIKMLQEQAQGVASLQSGSGLWHQMLDRPDSYLETSCSAMFTFAIARAINRGWLDAATYGPVAQAGWNGVTTQVTEDGKVNNVCVGTSYADDYPYYYARPHVDDVHGYGPVIMAGAEMIKLLDSARDPDGKLRNVPGLRGSPVYYLDRARDVPARAGAR